MADKSDAKKKNEDKTSESSPTEKHGNPNEGLQKTKSKEGESLKVKSKESNTEASKSKSLKESVKGGVGRIKKKLGSSIGFPARKSPSLESTQSTGAPGASKKPNLDDIASITPEGGLPPELLGESAYDCCVLLIYCPKHKKVAISKGDRGSASWFPYVALKGTDVWRNAAIGGGSFVISHGDLAGIASRKEGLPFYAPEIIHILKLQVPGAPKFISRVTYVVRINIEAKFECCRSDKRISWIGKDDVIAGNIEKLWGPEPFLWTEQATGEEITKRMVDEYSLDDVLQFAPREPPRNKEEELLKSAGFTERDITRLYTEFLTHCFPSQFMSSTSFSVFMTKLGWSATENRIFSIFKAFNYRSNGYLTFHELLLGLAAMDQGTRHGGNPGELRCGYIFRYYDSNNDGTLDYSDIQRMTADIFAGKQTEGASENVVEKDAAHRMEQVLKLKKTDKVKFPHYMETIANMTFRGTSVLFRSPVSVLNRISNRTGVSAQDLSGDVHPSIARLRYRGTCQACKAKNFRIAIFAVKMDFTGRIIDAKSMMESEGNELNWQSDDPVTEQLRTFSRETIFNPASLPNITILSVLKAFDAIHNQRLSATDVKGWNKMDRNYILTAVQTLCKKAEEIFISEPRCVKLSSPAFVLGDTHGNIADVMVYERNLWRMGAAVTPCNFLFLGDYVDRGEYGLEVACYLMSMKILAPDTFYLCRGNHEIRSIQKCYTFLKECNIKYGTRVGPQVFEACNKAFDRMPVCAVVDDTIFGAHGGIPTSLMKIDDLMKIPSPLQEPENECPAAWEMMWSDPMNASEFNDLAEFMKVKTEKIHGFLSNTKRGTAFFYTEEAVDNFLNINGLQYVVRGHEVMPLGYKFHLNGKVITVFSSSRYCGGTNEAAGVFYDSEEIRIVRFETQGNLE